MLTTKLTRQLQTARRQIAKGGLTDQQLRSYVDVVHKLNVGREFVRVEKISLRDGEELWDFIKALSQAVQTNRVVLGEGSLDVWLEGIYEDFVIVQDGNTGKFFKSSYERDSTGEFRFGEPVEVVAQWVDRMLVEQSATTKSQIVEITKRGGGVFSGIVL